MTIEQQPLHGQQEGKISSPKHAIIKSNKLSSLGSTGCAEKPALRTLTNSFSHYETFSGRVERRRGHPRCKYVFLFHFCFPSKVLPPTQNRTGCCYVKLLLTGENSVWRPFRLMWRCSSRSSPVSGCLNQKGQSVECHRTKFDFDWFLPAGEGSKQLSVPFLTFGKQS